MVVRTQRRLIWAFALTLLLLAVYSVVETRASTTHSITIANFAFQPTTVAIRPGDSMSWTNTDAASHIINGAAGTKTAWTSGTLATGDMFTRVFTQTGSFDFICTIHPSMRGTITVATALPQAYLPLAVGRSTTNTSPTSPPTPAPTNTPLPAPTIASGGRWSSAASWPGGRLPTAGAFIQIPAGVTMLLDISPPALRGLQIDGSLIFDRQDLNLTANWMMVHANGRLEIGTEAQPFRQRALITLIGNDPTENIMGMGTKLLGAMGGTLELHGAPQISWTQLNATAAPGARQITLAAAVDWKPGDRIVIAPTDYSPAETEERTVIAVSGTTVTLDQPLIYQHWGQIQALGTTGATMDERAEVGLLSRTITIRGELAPGSTFGGHMMFMGDTTTHLSNIELAGMGQLGLLGRYPMHWHFGADRVGSYLIDSAIHDTFQRGIVVHRTNDLLIRNNLIYNTVGHMVFIESANEVRNTFERNLLLNTRPVSIESRNPAIEFEHNLDAGDQAISRISGFWISNANNRFIGNHVAGILHGSAYWIVEGAQSTLRENDLGPIPQTPLLEFRDNLAHTIGVDPRYGNDGMRPTGNGLQIDTLASVAPSTVQHFSAWKTTMYGFWGIAGVCCGPWAQVTLDRMIVADAKSAIFNGEIQVRTTVRNSIFYGMTTNQPPGVTAENRRWDALFAHQHPDDRVIEVVSLYPCSADAPPGPDNPCFREKFIWENNLIAGWPPR